MLRLKSYCGYLLKRGFDTLCACIALLICCIPLLFLCGLIRMFLGKQVFFKQQRPGKNAQTFTIYKFRTMTDASDKRGNLLPDAKRLTRFGMFLRKASLDELPQLWNVLKGDMSLVGPRALLIEYLPLYNAEQKQRHLVKPGITGWAQVNGRNAISWEKKFEFDVWYVEHQSFWLDIKILWLTVLKVFKREGVSQAGHVTMAKFKGTHDGNK